MASDTLSARALKIYCRIEAVEGKIGFGRIEDRSHRTLCFIFVHFVFVADLVWGKHVIRVHPWWQDAIVTYSSGCSRAALADYFEF